MGAFVNGKAIKKEPLMAMQNGPTLLKKKSMPSIRTTNFLNQAVREVQRHTRHMNRFFTNESSSDRLMCGDSEMLCRNWKGKTVNPISTI